MNSLFYVMVLLVAAVAAQEGGSILDGVKSIFKSDFDGAKIHADTIAKHAAKEPKVLATGTDQLKNAAKVVADESNIWFDAKDHVGDGTTKADGVTQQAAKVVADESDIWFDAKDHFDDGTTKADGLTQQAAKVVADEPKIWFDAKDHFDDVTTKTDGLTQQAAQVVAEDSDIWFDAKDHFDDVTTKADDVAKSGADTQFALPSQTMVKSDMAMDAGEQIVAKNPEFTLVKHADAAGKGFVFTPPKVANTMPKSVPIQGAAEVIQPSAIRPLMTEGTSALATDAAKHSKRFGKTKAGLLAATIVTSTLAGGAIVKNKIEKSSKAIQRAIAQRFRQ